MKRFIAIILFSVAIATQPNVVKGQSFQNPILSGFYPDPSICKAGNDYYLVVSSFAYYPGLPIFHSTDLLNWRPIGAVLNRPEQLQLDGARVSRGLFAPSISFHHGKFYLVCTLVDKGGNFVVTTDDPKKQNWSNPVFLPQVDGIDPSLFFDDDGKSYIVYNSIPPDNISMHNGHRTIRMNEFNANSLKVISDNKIIVNGGTDMAKKPVWIEAPHIIKKDGWYYLICAEGGTAYNHSEVVFRTKSLQEPFIPYEDNPILTQRHLDRNRKNPVTTTGHADFTVGPDGKWWAVFLGCRPYEGEHFNTGRETFMAPVEWKNGWPHIELGGEEVKYSYPINSVKDAKAIQLNGNYFFKDEFSDMVLNNRYTFLRTPLTNWHTLKNGKLEMMVQPATCSDLSNPSFIAFRQSHLNGYAATELTFNAAAENEKAGLLVFQNEHHYYFIAKSVKNGKTVVQLYKGAGIESKDKTPELLAEAILQEKNNKPIQFKIEATGSIYSFLFAQKKNKWIVLKSGLDAKFLSTETAKGFVGCVYAMYATSGGVPSNNQAWFNWFQSKSDDAVYK